MSAFLVMLVAGMLVTGCLNTLLLKFQDQTCDLLNTEVKAAGCASFPEMQTFMMFIGESLCFVVIALIQVRMYWNSRNRTKLLVATEVAIYTPITSEDNSDGNEENNPLQATTIKPLPSRELVGWRKVFLALPAFCDICATTIMGVGLLLVPASVFQMCRGSLVFFVGVFSVIFLNRRLFLHQWAALVLVVLGVFLVGLSNVLYTSRTELDGTHTSEAVDPRRTILGIILIVGAQLFTASQYVVEEWILSRYSVEPLKVAAFEGLFGSMLSAIGILIAYAANESTKAGFNGRFDIRTGLTTVLDHEELWSAFLLFTVSIATFNFCGLSVTQTFSATSRSTIDTCRTVLIWAVSLLLGWEHFKFLQLVGFIILVYATLLFNNVIRPPIILSGRDLDSVHTGVETGREHTLE